VMEDALRRGSKMNWLFGNVSGSLNAISIEQRTRMSSHLKMY
jgi:hypothetical protein